jgi:DNA-binding helix-hairpin-helix protein with protein kinase domain
LISEIPSLVTVPPPADPDVIVAEGDPLEPRLQVHRRFWLVGVAISVLVGLVATARLGASAYILLIYGVLLAALVAARPPIAELRRSRVEAMNRADEAFEAAAARWREAAEMRPLEKQKAELQAKLATYRALPAKYAAERAKFEGEKMKHQLRTYLDTQLIADAKISNVGPKRKATLRSYGIETALDVEERLAATFIPGFGEATRGALRAWVIGVKGGFRYDASRPLDPLIVNDLRSRENRERSDLERDLRGGPQWLKTAAEQVITRREAIRPELMALASAAAKARADVQVLQRF